MFTDKKNWYPNTDTQLSPPGQSRILNPVPEEDKEYDLGHQWVTFKESTVFVFSGSV